MAKQVAKSKDQGARASGEGYSGDGQGGFLHPRDCKSLYVEGALVRKVKYLHLLCQVLEKYVRMIEDAEVRMEFANKYKCYGVGIEVNKRERERESVCVCERERETGARKEHRNQLGFLLVFFSQTLKNQKNMEKLKDYYSKLPLDRQRQYRPMVAKLFM